MRFAAVRARAMFVGLAEARLLRFPSLAREGSPSSAPLLQRAVTPGRKLPPIRSAKL